MSDIRESKLQPRGSQSRSKTKRLILILLQGLLLTLMFDSLPRVLAVDGCSQTGVANVCCDNSGWGPNCVYCAGSCTGKGSACSTSCGSTVDCTNKLSARSGLSTIYLTGTGSAVTKTYDWSTWFTNSDPTNCPAFKCRIRRNSDSSETEATTQSKWGLYWQSHDYGAKLVTDDSSCTECSYNSKQFRIYCYTYYNSAVDPGTNWVQSYGQYIQHLRVCDNAANYAQVAGPHSFTFVYSSENTGSSNEMHTAIKASSYITTPASYCTLENCQWKWWSSCSSSYGYASNTNDQGNGEDFTSEFETQTVRTNDQICLQCRHNPNYGSNVYINSAVVSYTVASCSSYLTITQPQATYNIDIADTYGVPSAPSQTYVLFAGYASYIATSQPTYCPIQKISLWYNDAVTTTYPYQWPTSASHSYSQTYLVMVYDSGDIGKMTLNLNIAYPFTFKIKYETVGHTGFTNAFLVNVQCGVTSTTIFNPTDLQTTQNYQIHTGGYYNAPYTYGTKPFFKVSPYTYSNSLCPITKYEFMVSQTNSSTPDYLTMTQSSLTSTMNVWVDDTRNFTVASYTFTIKVTAAGSNGNKIVYTNFVANVVYDCKYDNITYVRSIPNHERQTDMVMVGDHPVTKISGVVGTLSFYNLDLSTIFTNNASFYCPIQKYEIGKVYNYTTGAVESYSQFSSRMQVNEKTGLWEFTDMSRSYMNMYVFFRAYNGDHWSSLSAQHLIEINLEPKPFVDIYPPIFEGALWPITLTYNRSELFERDWETAFWRLKENRYKEFPLPQVTDEHTPPCTVKFLNKNELPYVSYDEDTHNVTIDEKLIEKSHDGTSEVYFELSDAKGNKKEYTLEIKISFKRNYFNNASVENITAEDNSTAIEQLKCPAKVMQITPLGEVQIQIKEEALKVFKEGQFNSNNIKMYIDPFQERDHPSSAWYSEVIRPESLNFNWSITLFELPFIFLQLDFNDVSAISPISGYNDYLVVKVDKADELFDLSSFPVEQQQKTCYLNTTIGKQIEKSVVSDTLSKYSEPIKNSIKWLFIIGAFISILGNFSFWFFLSLIRTFQLVMHLPLSRANFPPNVILFFEMLMPIAQFDILEGILGDDEPPSQALQDVQFEQVDQMRDLGYNNSNAFINLSTMSILLCLYVARMGIYFSFKLFNKFKPIKSPWILKRFDSLATTLFFYEILRLCLEGFLELAVSCWLNFFSPDPQADSSNPSDQLTPRRLLQAITQDRSIIETPNPSEQNSISSMIFSVLVLSVVWGVLPVISVAMLCPPLRNKLTEETTRRRIGALYNEQRLESNWTVAYNTIFIARRFAILMLFLPYKGPLCFEIMGVLYLNLGSLLYIGYNRALNRRLYNQLDFFDEYWIAILSLHLVLFTEWVEDAYARDFYGWMMIGLMLFNLLVKLIIIILENLYRIRMIWKRYFLPYWNKYIQPKLKCCEVCFKAIMNALRSLCKCCPCCRVKVKIEDTKPDLALTDPRGFSSNYLIIQQMNAARGRLSRKDRLRKEQEERRKNGLESSSGDDESSEGEKEEPRVETEEPLTHESSPEPVKKQSSLDKTRNSLIKNPKETINTLEMSKISEEQPSIQDKDLLINPIATMEQNQPSEENDVRVADNFYYQFDDGRAPQQQQEDETVTKDEFGPTFDDFNKTNETKSEASSQIQAPADEFYYQFGGNTPQQSSRKSSKRESMYSEPAAVPASPKESSKHNPQSDNIQDLEVLPDLNLNSDNENQIQEQPPPQSTKSKNSLLDLLPQLDNFNEKQIVEASQLDPGQSDPQTPAPKEGDNTQPEQEEESSDDNLKVDGGEFYYNFNSNLE